MACKQNLDLRCVLISDPSTLGAGAKTRLESRIKKFTPHCICRPSTAARSPAITKASNRGVVTAAATAAQSATGDAEDLSLGSSGSDEGTP